MQIEKVGIVGAGTMGHGIAQVLAVSGIDVTMRDISDGLVQKGRTAIAANLDRLVAKGVDERRGEGRRLVARSCHHRHG